jgi:hypothetical protein
MAALRSDFDRDYSVWPAVESVQAGVAETVVRE